MSTTESQETDTQNKTLQDKKAAHDYVATAVQVMTTRCQFFFEEFEGIHQSVQFLRNFRDQIRKDIELIEPPKPVETKEPYVMDLTHVKAD